MSEPRDPTSLPSYALGDAGEPSHFNAVTTRETAAQEAKSLIVGDAAFILRSDHKWTYAIVSAKEDGDEAILRFILDKDKNRKSFPAAQWGRYIRVIKADASEMVKLEAQEETAKASDEARSAAKAKVEPKKEPTKEESEPLVEKSERRAVILGEFSSEMGSWFSSKFNSRKAEENKPVMVEAEERDAQEPHAEDEGLSPPPELEDMPTEETKDKNKPKPQLGAMFSSFFSRISEHATAVASAAAPSPNPVSATAEQRDAVEENSTSTPAPDTMRALDTSTPAASEPEIPKPVPIKLLQTPIQFYKASTMTDDPAAAAIAATSFADEQNIYGLNQTGVTIVEHDPAAIATAEYCEHERLYGNIERQGVVVVDMKHHFEMQDIVVVE